MTLRMPTIPNVSELIRNNVSVPDVNAATAGITSALDELQSSAGSLVSGPVSQITSAIDSVKDRVSGALSGVQSSVANLQEEFAGAISSLAAGPEAFLSRMESVQNLFPDVDVQSLLNSMSDPNFSLLNSIPNIDLNSLGEMLQLAPPNVPSLELPEPLPELPELPEITTPEIVEPLPLELDLGETLSKLPVTPTGGIDYSKASELEAFKDVSDPVAAVTKSRLSSFVKGNT